MVGSAATRSWRDGPWDDYDEDDDDGEDGEDGDNGDEDGDNGNGGGGRGGPGRWPFSPPGPGRPGGRAPFAATINLLVPVGTAFGWSAMPGEAGGDIIDPRTLREMMQAASRHPETRWCVTLVGEDGTAAAHGCARGRHTWDPPPDTTRNTVASAAGTTPAASASPGQQPTAAQAAAPGRVPRPAEDPPRADRQGHLRPPARRDPLPAQQETRPPHPRP